MTTSQDWMAQMAEKRTLLPESLRQCSLSRHESELMEPALATSLDFASLDEIDPSLVEGYKLFFEREVPLELRTYDGTSFPTEVGTLEALRVKVLINGDPKAPEAIRVELSSENNLFFNYIHEMTKDVFAELQEGQRLMIDFIEYPSLILRMLNSCLKEPHSFLGVMVFTRDKTARLDFIQNMEHKFVELLSMKFVESSDEFVRRQITYRYNNMKSKLNIMHAKLADVNSLVSCGEDQESKSSSTSQQEYWQEHSVINQEELRSLN